MEANKKLTKNTNQPSMQPWHNIADPKRVAGLVWLIAVVELLLSAFIILLIRQIPESSITTTQDLAVMSELQHMANGVSTSLVWFGVVPACVLGGMGLAIRNQVTIGVIGALMVTLTQSCVLAMLMAKQLLSAVSESGPAGMTMVILLYGTPLGVLLVCVWKLFIAWQPSSKQPYQTETESLEARPIH